jgi:hypothetical protein
MASPAGHSPYRAVLALLVFGKRTCKPNSVVCGHSSRRRVAANAHQRPTRRFRQLHEAPQRRRPVAGDPARAAWAHRASAQRPHGSWNGASLPIWSCSVWGLPCLRSYGRSGALLPHHFTLTPAPGQPAEKTRLALQGGPSAQSHVRDRVDGVAEAVSFLWHWPSAGLPAHIPDVIRHTALRSSDFPPPELPLAREDPAATARSSCQS